MKKCTNLEQVSEVRTACRKNDLVRGEAAAVAGERDVDEVLNIPQLTYGAEDARLKVVPSKRVLLLPAGR